MLHFLGFVGAVLGILCGRQYHYFVFAGVISAFIAACSSKRQIFIYFRLSLFLFIVAFIRSSIVGTPNPGEVCSGYVTREMLGAQVVRVVKCETVSNVDNDIIVKCSGFNCGGLYTYKHIVVGGTLNGRMYGSFDGAVLVENEPLIKSSWYGLLRLGRRVKASLYEKYLAMSNDTTASMAVSIVFGSTNVPVEFSTIMKELGIVHVMAVSGINITYLMSFMSIVINKLNKYTQYSVKIFVLVLLNVIVGPSVSLLRATLTFLQQFLSKMLGNRRDSTEIFFVLALIPLISPRYLVDYSYLLVSAACIGIYIVVPVVTRKIRNGILKELIVSMVVWGCVLPMQWILFKNITWYGGIITFILAPLVEVITITGYVVVPLAFASSMFAWPYLLLVSVFVSLCNLFHITVIGTTD